jgi:hypothetical protein
MLLRELGYRWWSPLGDTVTREEGLVLIPFDWALVDAYHLMERFAELRVGRGESRVPLSPDEVAARMVLDLERGAGAQMVILHPFLMVDPVWCEGARRVLAAIAELGRQGGVWTVAGGELAGWIEGGAG